MPRWLAVPVTLTLFTAAMLALGWVLRQVVPGLSEWLGRTLGETGANAIVIAAIAGASLYGFWPRNPDGTMRRLPRWG